MLTSILSKETCKSCKICCNYSAKSLWDIPGFTNDEFNKAVLVKPELKEQIFSQNRLIYFKPVKIASDKFLCPFLADKGCILEADKPFKCAIWPLYVIRCDKQLYLALSNVCPNIPKLSPTILSTYLNESIERIKSIIAIYPDLVEEPKEHFHKIISL